MGNQQTRGKSKSLGPSIDLLMSHLTMSHMAKLLELLKRINLEKTLQGAIHKTIESSCDLLDCDRATLFIVDEITDELIIKDANTNVDIRLKSSEGIAGHVYGTGEVLNIPDCYKDERFNKATDAKTGYHTTSLLCSPVYDSNGNIVAILQTLNKKNPENPEEHIPFGVEDETLIDYLAGQLGVILLNIKISEDAVKAKGKVDAMFDIVRSLHSDMGVNSIIFTLTEKTPQLVEADRCTLYLVDEKHDELWSLSGGVQIRIPKSAGIAGTVATTGETINIADAYQDDRFNSEVDKKSGYHTKTILCLPIKSKGNVVGVLQLINKSSGAFNFHDEELLDGFLSIVGGIIASSQLFALSKKKKRASQTGDEFADRLKSPVQTEELKKKFSQLDTFAEDEEEGEDDF